MKFSLFVTAAAAFGSLTGALAAPQPEPNAATLVKKPTLSASRALTFVNQLNTVLDSHSANINKTVATVKTGASNSQKDAAAKEVGAQMQQMAVAINKAVGEIGLAANNAHYKREADSELETRARGSVQALANALKHTLITAAGTVNTALAVLGLTPLLAFLTPLTGSLSGLVLTLKAVVDALLPILNVLLDGVVLGLTGLLAGLIL